MAKRMSFKKIEMESWLDKMEEDQFRPFADFAGKEIEINAAFTYIGKEGTKTAGKKGFTAKFLADGKEWYSTSFGTAIVRQGDEIVEALKSEESVIVGVKVKLSKNGNEYVYFD